jgi:hypothetical protein
MSKSAVQNKQILSEIRLGFLMFRRDHGGKQRGYPKAIKDRAVSGIERGCTHSEVAQAAGVSEESIRSWRNSMGTTRSIAQEPRPVELKLVQTQEELSILPQDRGPPGATAGATAHIEFRSGARMTVPVSALSEQLLCLLMGGAS